MAKNSMTLRFDGISENVGIVRVTAAAFATQIEFTLTDIDEIKVAVSEAVSNSIIHGYRDFPGQVELKMELFDDYLEFKVTDWGRGIEDVIQARQPAWSCLPDRMGLGFVFMESFMDEVFVNSEVNKGTQVCLIKKFNKQLVH